MKTKLLIIAATVSVFTTVFSQNVERERIYLQTDKQLYLSGEQILMQLYTADSGGKLTALSKVAYVELLSGEEAEAQIKLAVSDGTANGYMTVPASLPSGYYRLVAYTRYMRNENNNAFFEKTIAVVNPATDHSSPNNAVTVPDLIEKTSDDTAPVTVTTDRNTYPKLSKGEVNIGLPQGGNFNLTVSIARIDPLFTPSTHIRKWKEDLKNRESLPFVERFLPEYEGMIIDAVMVDTETNLPASKAQNNFALLSFPGSEIEVYGSRPGEDGNISFITQTFEGERPLSTAAISTTGRTSLRVDLSTPFVQHIEKTLPKLPYSPSLQDYVTVCTPSLSPTPEPKAASGNKSLYFNFTPKYSFLLDEYTRFPTMEDIFIEFIAAAKISKSGNNRVFQLRSESSEGMSAPVYSPANILVLLDNVPVINHELMIAYNPNLLKKVDVYLGKYIIGGHTFNGVLAFWSYKNNYPEIRLDKSTQIFQYHGISPSQTDNTDNDMRTTLLWSPNIQTNGKNHLTIPFKTSNVAGHYLITVEGINSEGTIINTVHKIDVSDI